VGFSLFLSWLRRCRAVLGLHLFRRIELNTSELTKKARSVARCLTYNDDTHQFAAKHLLLEMAHRLDSLEIQAHKKTNGLLLINSVGKARYATLIERIAFKLFAVLPKTI
jgi:hypothetical protein